MVEAGDTVSATLKKEFGEEAMNSLEASEKEKKEIERHINELFKTGTKVRKTAALYTWIVQYGTTIAHDQLSKGICTWIVLHLVLSVGVKDCPPM